MNARPQSALRAAIDLALAVARDGEAGRPPVPAPARLRPYLGFAKLPPAASEVARRVVDDDEEFRSRVLAVAEVDVVGPAGWAWLHRIDGWEDVVAAEEAARTEALDRRGSVKEERQLARRLEQTAEALRRAEQREAEVTKDLEELRAEAVVWRRERRGLLEQFGILQADVERVQAERTELVRRLKQSERVVAEKAADNRELRATLAAMSRNLNGVAPAVAPAAPISPDEHTVDSADRRGAVPDDPAGPSGSTSSVPARTPAAEPFPELDRRALADAVTAASAAAAQLGRALEAASRTLAGAPSAGELAGGVRRESGAIRPDRPIRSGRVPRAVRRALRMPPGTFDDSEAAARYLVRVPHVVLLVDGYNVAKQGWPELELAHQRERLLDALAGLQALTGAAVEVVFDGVDDGTLVCRSALSRVRVCFTPTALEADDRILDMVGHVEPTRPVVVVSSDRRVRDGARARGANVLASEQILALLR